MDLQNKMTHFQVGKEMAEQLTITELVSQLIHTSKGIDRLSIKPYNWWNEALHGVARAGIATVFPQAIGMAATFDEKLMFDTAEIISTEARAKYNESRQKGDYGWYKGLTMWSPNVNIFRDPRWGRGQETYGEDPYLTGLLGNAFIKGLQGDHPKYIKTAACAKHYAVHSGPEELRHSFNAEVSKKDLFETYLPAFKTAVKDAKVCGVMGAYNRVNGEACCASQTLIQKILCKCWGFEGYFVSDCSAINDIRKGHKITRNPAMAAATALNTGCDLECGKYYRLLPAAYVLKYVTREKLEQSAARLLAVRSALGMFDDDCPYDFIKPEENATDENEEFSVKVAEKSLVLLENNGVLPLMPNAQKILVVGYNAENELAYLGNYFGTPKRYCKMPEGVKNENENTEYVKGYSYNLKENAPLQKEAVEQAQNADVILFCSGLDCSFEGEEAGEMINGGGGTLGKQGDRITLDLPDVQKELLEKLFALGKKLVILNFSGSCVDLRDYKNRADAILQCWYPGGMGGQAIANVLFGKAVPCGKLPVTFYNSVADLPDFCDYSMENRTYRYYKGDVQYPFGYGLSYTDFELTDYELKGGELHCRVKNTGNFAGETVLQLYMTCPPTDYCNPIRSLMGIQRVLLKPDEETEVVFPLRDKDFYSVNPKGDTVYLHGEYPLYVYDGQNINTSVGVFVNRQETAVVERCPI